MNAVFADTAYYLALLNAQDELHLAAVAATERLRGPLLRTDWILIELADGMSRARHRGMAAALIQELRSDPRVSIVRFPASS